MAKKNVEKEMNQVSGGNIDVKALAARWESGDIPSVEVKKSYDPSTAFASGRSIKYKDAHSTIADFRDKKGRPVAGR